MTAPRKGGTPAISALERAGVEFRVHAFDNDVASGDRGYGLAAAAALGVAPERVFKTLLVASHDTRPHQAVGIVPVTGQLALKAMAQALGAKRVEMLAPADAERITGYVVGGISPFGQRTPLPTVIDDACRRADTIFVSGGKRGLDIEIAPGVLIDVLGAVVAPIAN